MGDPRSVLPDVHDVTMAIRYLNQYFPFLLVLQQDAHKDLCQSEKASFVCKLSRTEHSVHHVLQNRFVCKRC